MPCGRQRVCGWANGPTDERLVRQAGDRASTINH